MNTDNRAIENEPVGCSYHLDTEYSGGHEWLQKSARYVVSRAIGMVPSSTARNVSSSRA